MLGGTGESPSLFHAAMAAGPGWEGQEFQLVCCVQWLTPEKPSRVVSPSAAESNGPSLISGPLTGKLPGAATALGTLMLLRVEYG